MHIACLQVFREEVFASLSSIKDKFHFTFINADASPDVVKKVSVGGHRVLVDSYSRPVKVPSLSLSFLLPCDPSSPANSTRICLPVESRSTRIEL